MENKFTKIMNEKADYELLEIVTKLKDDYQLEAVKAAKKELESRNLDNTEIEKAQSQLERKEQIKNNIKQKPLEAGYKILFFFFGWGILPWLIAITYRVNGFDKKYKDAWRFIIYGVLMYFVLIVLTIIIFAL